MRKIKFSDVGPHLVALGIFLVVIMTFFSPIFFENKVLDQQDIQQYIGSSKVLRDFRDATGEEGLWAGSVFSGMPAYLVNLQWSDGVVVNMKKVLSLWMPHPVRNIFAASVCYYILLLSFSVRPYLAIAGALAFGLSSYMIIGLSAGHNARIGAIAFMPLVMAGIHIAFTGKRILGFGVTAAGLALQLRENHLQITYYLILIVAVYGLVQLVAAARVKQIKEFFISLAVLVPAAVIASATFFGQFWAITEYTRYSIRGPSELAKPGADNAGDGLTKAYAFAYNYGIWEPMTLLVPGFYGGSSGKFLVEDQQSETYKALAGSQSNELANQLANYSGAYWGPQSFTAGPYYGGAMIVFLFVAGILFADRKYVWWLVPLSMLSLMLSWGDSFSSFNYFMFDYFPGYNKFRSVNFALIIILFAMPLLGLVGLEKFLADNSPRARKKLLLAFSIVGGLCLLILLLAGMGSFVRGGESQLPAWFLHALQADRRSLLRSDAFRSLAFVSSVFILLYLNAPKKVSMLGFYVFMVLMVTADAASVDKRYFTATNYQRKRETKFVATEANLQIQSDKSYYRVYNINGPMAEATTSYFHNSIGGYHGAKMRRYQDLYDSCILPQTERMFTEINAKTAADLERLDFGKAGVINMLNAKYMLYGNADGFVINRFANGPAWFVNEVVAVNSPAEELKKVGEVNTKVTAVIDHSRFTFKPLSDPDSLAMIRLTDQKPYWMKYESQSAHDGLAVFSEIYYPKGWHASIDGKEVPIIRADYVLRALEVPAGTHVIEFRFEPEPYVVGNRITMASGWVLLILVLGSLGWSFKKS